MPAAPLLWMRSTNVLSELMLVHTTFAPTLMFVTAGDGYTHWPCAFDVNTIVTWFATVTSADFEIAGNDDDTSTFSVPVSIVASVGIIIVAFTVAVPFAA